jgi:hypothetical protein
MIMLRRRSIAGRAGIFAAVIGVLALTSLPGASAVSSASRSTTATVTASVSASSPASVEGHTRCVPWPKPTSLGLKCTGTYSGNTAFDPWTWKNLSASDQPVVTISQAKDLTDQDVQINWSNFTPSIGSNNYEPNPTNDASFYQVSIFQCNGANPDASDGYVDPAKCYTTPVGTDPTNPVVHGPLNGELENTLDNSVPAHATSTDFLSPWGPLQQFASQPQNGGQPWPTKGWENNPGGNPATWTGQADFHIEAPTPRSKGGTFNCGPSTPCSLVIDPNWGGTPSPVGCVADSTVSCSYADTSLCGDHYLGAGIDPTPGYISDPGNPGEGTDPDPNLRGDLLVGSSNQAFASPDIPAAGKGSPAGLQAASAACWVADRIVIPLSFAPTAKDCPNQAPEFYAQGSPMMQDQMLQWQAGWCNGQAPVTLNYVFNSESLARQDFLAGGQAAGARVDMALVTLPADAAAQQGSSRKFTYAPLANSGTGIAYYVDDGTTGSQINGMVLNPQLLAKLITQSYTLQYDCPPSSGSPPQAGLLCDPAVKGNSFSLFDDPEFVSLNRHCQPYGQPKNYLCDNPAVDPNATSDDFPPDNDSGNNGVYIGGFLPTVLQQASDMTYDLTGWVAANPDAASFLAGKNDPWGMRVNSNYLGISYPIPAFNPQDNGFTVPLGTGPFKQCPGETDCGALVGDQDESMLSSWNPQTDLDTIAADLLVDQPTAQEPDISCGLPSGTCTELSQLAPTTTVTPDLPSTRALLSVLDLGDIANYQFPAADLVNAAGKAVNPTQDNGAGVEAAVKDMKTNPDGITQYANFASTDPKAYPLAMVDYAMVPTCGLSHAEASAIADFLTKAATTGQVQGEAPGQLAPGYYPLTAKQKAQTLTAAAEVKTQDCRTVPPDKKIDGQTAPNDTAPPSHPGTRPGSTTPSGKKSPSSAATTPGGAVTPGAQTAAFGQKSADSGLAGLLLLLAIIAGALLLIGGPAAWAITATGKWPVVLGWLRPVQARLTAALGWLTGLVVRRA